MHGQPDRGGDRQSDGHQTPHDQGRPDPRPDADQRFGPAKRRREGGVAAQPAGRRRRIAPRPNDGVLRSVGQRQVVVGDGHDLRRGSTAVRREPVVVREAVHRSGPKAEGRIDRGSVAGGRVGTKEPRTFAAIDRRHGHRGVRLSTHPDGPVGHDALPGLRRAGRHPDAGPDRRQGDVARDRDESVDRRADRGHARPGVERHVGEPPQPGLFADPCRRTHDRTGRRQAARPAKETIGRGRRRPRAHRRVGEVSHQRQRRTGVVVGRRRHAVGVGRRRPRRMAVGHRYAFATPGVHRLRSVDGGTDPAPFLVQQRTGMVPIVRGAGRSAGHQPGGVVERRTANGPAGGAFVMAAHRQ